MITSKFKKGDRVRRVRGTDKWGVQLGGEYIVEFCTGNKLYIQGSYHDFFTEYFELVEEKKEELPSFIKVIPATAERREILNHWTPDGHFLHIVPKGNCVSLWAHENHQSISKQKLHDLGQHLIEVSKWMEE